MSVVQQNERTAAPLRSLLEVRLEFEAQFLLFAGGIWLAKLVQDRLEQGLP